MFTPGGSEFVGGYESPAADATPGGHSVNVGSGSRRVTRFAKMGQTGSSGGAPRPAANWHQGRPPNDRSSFAPRFGFKPRFGDSVGTVGIGASLGSGGGGPVWGGGRVPRGSRGGSAGRGSSRGGRRGFPVRDNRGPLPNKDGQLPDTTNTRSPWTATSSIRSDVGFGPNCEVKFCSRCRDPVEPVVKRAAVWLIARGDQFVPDGGVGANVSSAGRTDSTEQMDVVSASNVEEASLVKEEPTNADVEEGGGEREEVGDKLLESVIGILMETKSGVMKANRLCQKAEVQKRELEALVDTYPGILFLDVGAESDRDCESDVTSVASKVRIKLVPTFHLCSAHNRLKKGCEDKLCRKLHLCKNFVLEHKCAAFKRGKCRREHRFSSDHNLRVLRRELDVPDLTDVLSAAIVLDLITFCFEEDPTDGDEESGEDEPPGRKRTDGRGGTDDDGDGGRGGKKQARNEDWGKPSRGRRDDSDEDGGRTNRGRGLEDSGNGAAARNDLICANHAKGRCYSKRCKKIHGRLNKLYMWQVTDEASGDNWVNLSGLQSDEVEVAFTDAGVTKVEVDPPNPSEDPYALLALMGNLTWEADFESMTMTAAAGSDRPLYLRRVGGHPSVKDGGDTKWCWFFENEKGDWTPYGQVGGDLLNFQLKSNLSSDEVEEHFVAQLGKKGGADYAASPDAAAVNARPIAGLDPLKFSSVLAMYELDFSKMTQRNLSNGTERKVRRRPAPLTTGAKAFVTDGCD